MSSETDELMQPWSLLSMLVTISEESPCTKYVPCQLLSCGILWLRFSSFDMLFSIEFLSFPLS